MSNEIRNCEFSYKCPKAWDELTPMSVTSQRHCAQCQRTVHLCLTADDLAKAILRNDCVAVELDREYGEGREVRLGNPKVPGYGAN